MMRRERSGESGQNMEKCGICGRNVPDQPQVTPDGKCNRCGAELTMNTKK